MPRISSGKRYAQASFELALERNELESWQKGLRKVASLAQEEELLSLLQNPRLPFDAKKDILQKLLGEINPLVLNLALLLVGKGVFMRAADISKEYDQLLDAHQGIERAQVISAVSLEEEQKTVISRRLGEIANRKVMIEDKIDPSIIGGFIARLGDILIDGSVRQRLETLKKSLVEAGR